MHRTIRNADNRAMRRQIRAPKGHVLVPVDYGQLEARLIAMASRDRAFCQSVINGEDVHSHWLGELLAMYPEYLERLAWKD